MSRLQAAGGWTYKYTCCGKTSRDYEPARNLPGCTKGKHRSKHHTDYPYPAYYFYMNELVGLLFNLLGCVVNVQAVL